MNNIAGSLESTEAFAWVLILGNASRAYFLEHKQIIGALIKLCDGEHQPVEPPATEGNAPSALRF